MIETGLNWFWYMYPSGTWSYMKPLTLRFGLCRYMSTRCTYLWLRSLEWRWNKVWNRCWASQAESKLPGLYTVQSALVLQDTRFENIILCRGMKAICQAPRHFCTLDKSRPKTKELSCFTRIAVDILTWALTESQAALPYLICLSIASVQTRNHSY